MSYSHWKVSEELEWQNAQIEREIAADADRQQARNLAGDRTVDAPARLDQAVWSAKSALAQAQAALAEADRAIRPKLAGVSDQLARLRYEDATTDAAAAVRRAEEQLNVALERRGRYALAAKELAALEAGEGYARREAEAVYRSTLQRIDGDLARARARLAAL